MSKTTLEQDRAAHALKCVEVIAKEKNLAGRYRSYAESLPAHIVMGGLGQAVATELAAARLVDEKKRDDGNKAHERLANDLAAWLGKDIYKKIAKENGGQSLMTAIASEHQKDYLRAQAEALAWLVWLKKFCQAMLPKSNEE
jgi:CRISPR-associated protein Cmr5